MNQFPPYNLQQLLTRTAERFPEHGIGFIRPDHSIRFLTFPEVLGQSMAMLAGMQSLGMKKGDRVILSLEKSEEIIPVLWGCFAGGIIPALLQPPVTFTDYNPAAEKTEKVFALLEKPRVILSHEHAGNWRSSHIPANCLVDVAGLPGDPQNAGYSESRPEEIALIQFSSGSTGDPKGVLLSHRNILVNTGDIIRGIRLGPGDVAVNWMPLYHDMGLIGFHITPVSVGVNQYFLDPVDFVKNPGLWIDTMSTKRCTITACPNFGQVVVNRFLGRKSQIKRDLSSIRILFNGAEPISVDTMRTFLANLAEAGLDPAAMFPAYGLAEATLAVTFPDPLAEAVVTGFRRNDLVLHGEAIIAGDRDASVIELVNLGKTLDHCEILIAGPDGNEVPENRVGHVHVRGGNVSSGYFGTPTPQEPGGWLKTGDLGFRHAGDLYITGRIKDIIFINGINFYAHDLETIALQVEGLSRGKVVITGYFDESDGRDRLLVFLVGTDNESTRALCHRVRSHLSSVIGLTAETFIPVRSADIPRTSSGKVQRYKMTQRFLKGEFEQLINL